MVTRIRPLTPGASPDAEVNRLLREARDGWWRDAHLFGVIAHRPDLLKAMVPVLGTLFGQGKVEPYVLELMRLKTAQVKSCTYGRAIRMAALRDQVQPLEPLVVGGPVGSDARQLRPREAVAVELAERMAVDPRAVDDAFWARLAEHFDHQEVVELVFGAALFHWADALAIALRLDGAPDGPYGADMAYRSVPFGGAP